jgi:hypothetical protein
MIEEELTWTQLERMGLSITQRQAPTLGWGFTWRGRNWEGPYKTRIAALEAAFSRAIDILILYRHCPFPAGDCPLLRPPPLSRFEADLGEDEEEGEHSRRHNEDWES